MRRIKNFMIAVLCAVFAYCMCACSNSNDSPPVIYIVSGGNETETVTINGKDFKIVSFGSWPQTIKAANVSVDVSQTKKVGLFTYCKGSDGEWYFKTKEKAYSSGYKYSDGTKVAQSSANSYKWFKVEPIKWRVLTDNYNGSGKKLLLAEIVFPEISYYDFDAFNYDDVKRNIDGKVVYSNNYEHSKIRALLNGLSWQTKTSPSASQSTCGDYKNKGILQTAFSEEDQAAIAVTVVDNSVRTTLPDNFDDMSDSDKKWFGNGNNSHASDTPTHDKLFLLSEQEVTRAEYGFSKYSDVCDKARVRVVTDYAKASGAPLNTYAGKSAAWWLRSPWHLDSCAHFVDGDGAASRQDGGVNFTNGFAPALCLD